MTNTEMPKVADIDRDALLQWRREREQELAGVTHTEAVVVMKTTEDRAYQEDVLAVMLEFSQMPFATDDGWMIEAMAVRIVALQDALREAIRDNTANADASRAARRRIRELERVIRQYLHDPCPSNEFDMEAALTALPDAEGGE